MNDESKEFINRVLGSADQDAAGMASLARTLAVMYLTMRAEGVNHSDAADLLIAFFRRMK